MTFEQIKEALKDKDLSFEQRQWIAYIEGILNKGRKPNDHAKYCKEKLIESINEQKEMP
jgi:hypothetical protein